MELWARYSLGEKEHLFTIDRFRGMEEFKSVTSWQMS